MKLNLGSCGRDFPGFTSVDIVLPADQVVDLSGPWPWLDSSVEEIRAYDIFEHIGDCSHVSNWVCKFCEEYRRHTLEIPHWVKLGKRDHLAHIHVMEQSWRVLEPGGLLDIHIPTTDGRGAWQDPTHVSFWNRNTFCYFTAGDPRRERFARYYGILASFHVVSEEQILVDGVPKLNIVLEAVK